MKQNSLKLIGIMSCLMILATLSIFGQNEFNKKPLQDFADNLSRKVEIKEVDLDKPFSVTLDGYLTKEGKFDIRRSKFTKSEGDAKMVEVAKSAIEAASDSGIFAYLSGLGVEKLKIVLSQDEKDVSAILTSEMPTVEKAKTISAGLSGLFAIGKTYLNGRVEEILLNATIIQVQEKNCALNFMMPKEEAHRLLKNELQKAKEKRYSN